MIYIDSSVALAHLLAEDRRPGAAFWGETLIASRLLEYEVTTRLNNLRASVAVLETGQALVDWVALLELIPEVLQLARLKVPVQVRTLDALHLASAEFLRRQGAAVAIASYDVRMAEAAKAMGLPLWPLQ